PSVDIERTVEVSGGAVDVDVEGVERRPSLLERVGHHVTRMVQDLDHRRQGGGPGSATAVDAGAPERLVGVDVAGAGDQRLVQEETLDLGVSPADPSRRGPGVEGRVERIGGDV